MGDRANFVREVSQDLKNFPHGFGHLCRGKRIQTSGHSDFGILSNFRASSIFTWVLADTASAACPAQSGSLAITSITFAAVI